nr:reverse transcriptase domain-containing protein [Tanacetum cinerariifolium]
MDGINIDDLTIQQYFRLTQENQTPSMVKKVDDMTISEYKEYKEMIKMQYNRILDPTFQPILAIAHPAITQPLNFLITLTLILSHQIRSLIMTLRKWSLMKKLELSSEEDLDEWLNAEMEKHMSKQEEKNKEDALIAIIKSIREEFRVVHKNNFTNLPLLEELNTRSFLLPFTINNYNSYAIANIDTSNNVMPRSIYEHLKLANLEGDAMSVKMDDMTQQETLGIVKNVMVKINKFEFPCDFVVTEMPENLREMIILGRPS